MQQTPCNQAILPLTCEIFVRKDLTILIMSDIKEILHLAVKKGASDIFILAGLPVSVKKDEIIHPIEDTKVNHVYAEQLICGLYELAGRNMSAFIETGDDDFSASISGVSRFRINAYRQRGSMAAVIRVVHFEIPGYKDLNIPEAVMSVAENTHGLILVTGPSGSGKSTTQACIIDSINEHRNAHIVILEDPIEYLHSNKKSVISQREIGCDSKSYLTALRASLRQAPNVILLGEMRDYETIQVAMTAAETGHLVIATLHTVGAVNSIDRIIDVFPSTQQAQIRMQLSMILRSVISQFLVPGKSGTMLPAFEIMHVNNSIRNLIRESKTHQIGVVIQACGNEGMIGMDKAIERHFRNGLITKETAMKFSSKTETLERKA